MFNKKYQQKIKELETLAKRLKEQNQVLAGANSLLTQNAMHWKREADIWRENYSKELKR